MPREECSLFNSVWTLVLLGWFCFRCDFFVPQSHKQDTPGGVCLSLTKGVSRDPIQMVQKNNKVKDSCTEKSYQHTESRCEHLGASAPYTCEHTWIFQHISASACIHANTPDSEHIPSSCYEQRTTKREIYFAGVPQTLLWFQWGLSAFLPSCGLDL